MYSLLAYLAHSCEYLLDQYMIRKKKSNAKLPKFSRAKLHWKLQTVIQHFKNNFMLIVQGSKFPLVC